ncbi:dexamethasone-induced Ras-related protein 1-like [Mizuhopecten yessoensis]|uniref:Dexamethasone-induced Ras-related protein 1 n=1 Tax=Mizuhopecten yessoensis TaxID=6573 RepID=A0A210QPX5_MIZYE|nr:dexamethasone-induced Ras-related protein 1-like [Mizuhopecten yessoensis]OWF50771.1 Dexamethasone-induced Ras-related protein 1 [Mizuhopecten yessoensis]
MAHKQLVVVLGSGSVGKTSILHKYLNGTFSHKYTQTVEDVYSTDVCIDGERIMIEFLDTSGSIEFPAMRRLAIQKANAFVLVFALDREESFAEVKRTWREIKASRNDQKDTPCIVIGNKLDRENYREVEYFEALNWVDNNGLEGMMQEVSSKTGANFDNVFAKLFKQIHVCKAYQQIALNTQSRKNIRIKKRDNIATTSHITRSGCCFAFGKRKETS